ncbi:MAG: radical SAM protein [Spirochaetes bacterium]|nr:radical SAM protein [Spirochaetota bacterium]
MKILLISANKSVQPYPVYPLGLDYVSAQIPSQHEVEIFDIHDFEDMNSFAGAVKKFSPDIVGVSLRNIDNTDTSDIKYYIKNYQLLIHKVREASDAPVVLGGSGFTIFPAEVMNELDADYGIIGEGERFNFFLDALENKKNPLEIPGVITRESSEIIPPPWNEKIERKFRPDSTSTGFYIKNGGMLNLQSKRGCAFNCIYCTYPHIEGKKLRLFAPDEIAKTARELQDAGAKYIFITDSAFNCNYAHSMEVAKAFAKAGVSIPWGAFFAPSNPPDDYYRILADSGLSHVEFGTESLSDTVLAAYRKSFKVKDVMRSHELALKSDLYIAHYLLFNGPGEDKSTFEETLVNAEKLSYTVLFMFCGMRIYPHTELFDIAVREGQIDPSQSLLEPVFYNSADITSEEIIKTIQDRYSDRSNWVIGSGGRKTARLIKMMYKQGYTGPLWEQLIQ